MPFLGCQWEVPLRALNKVTLRIWGSYLPQLHPEMIFGFEVWLLDVSNSSRNRALLLIPHVGESWNAMEMERLELGVGSLSFFTEPAFDIWGWFSRELKADQPG